MSRELTDKIKQHLCERLQNDEVNNKEAIEIIQSIASFLNVQTYSDYATREKISYNGVLDRIKTGKVECLKLFNVNFVIDNK